MDIQKFIAKNKAELIRALEQYLSNELSHQDINDFAWDLISQGEAIPKSEPNLEGEEVFWCAVWSIQHLADEEHMESKFSIEELSKLLELLKSGGAPPEGWSARRP